MNFQNKQYQWRQKAKVCSGLLISGLLLISFTLACAPIQPGQTSSVAESAAAESVEAYDDSSESSTTLIRKENEMPAASTEAASDRGADAPPEAARDRHGASESSAGSGRSRQNYEMKAGEVNDNENWADYLAYRCDYVGPRVHDRDISSRYIIEVLDERGYPVLDANVRIFLDNEQRNQEVYQSYTYANGQTLFHPRALNISQNATPDFLVVVQKENVVRKFTMPGPAVIQGISKHAVRLDLTQASSIWIYCS